MLSLASPGPLVLKGLPDDAEADRQVYLSSGGSLPHQASWPWQEGWWKDAGSHAHWHLEAQVQPRTLAGFSQALLWQAQAWGVDSPDSLSRRLNLSLSGWNGCSGCLGQVLTPDAWTEAQSSRHLLQKTPLTHISQWSEAVRQRPKEVHHWSISHGGYHTGTAGLKPEKPSLETTNVQCPGVVHLPHPPSPIHQHVALQHPLEAPKGKNMRRMCWAGEEGTDLEVRRAWRLGPAYGHSDPGPRLFFP